MWLKNLEFDWKITNKSIKSEIKLLTSFIKDDLEFINDKTLSIKNRAPILNYLERFLVKKLNWREVTISHVND